MGIRSRKNLKMTKCLALKHIDFIKLLASYREKSKQFKSLIKCASTEELNAISEVVLNILRGILPFETSKKQKFAKHAKYLRFIANPQKNSATKRKKALISKGRWIVAPLLSVAIPLLMDIFSKK